MNVGGWSVFAEWTVEAAILPADGDDALDRMGIFPGSRRGRTSMDKEAMDKESNGRQGKQWTRKAMVVKESKGAGLDNLLISRMSSLPLSSLPPVRCLLPDTGQQES